VPDHSARVTYSKDVFGQVPSYDAPGTDYGPGTDRHTWANNDSASKPNVGPDADWLCKLQPFSSHLSFDRVGCGIDLNRGAKENIAADGDLHYIEHHAIEIEKDFAAQADICAVVAKERRLYPGIRCNTKELSQQTLTFLVLVLVRVVKALAHVAAPLPFLAKVGVKRII
jgi:hypothetical protein